MNNTKKKKMLNVMNATAQAVKLGDSLPVSFIKIPKATDITSSKTDVDIDVDYSAIVAVSCVASDGTYRAVTEAVKTDNGVKVKATSMSAGDTVCVTVI